MAGTPFFDLPSGPFSTNALSDIDIPRTPKRKRGSVENGLGSSDEDASSPEPDTRFANPFAQAELPPGVARQYQVAGQAFDEELPGADFPHRPLDQLKRKSHRRSSALVAELASLDPTLATSGLDNRTNLASNRQQHLKVLVTIMYKSLFEGDYARASRAFANLLRVPGIDIRNDGLWGIGAECLLRTEAQLQQARERSRPTGPENHPSTNTGPVYFTAQGFARAKQYYERLILEYPYRPRPPSSHTSSLQFHTILFELWIAFVDDRYKQATAHRSGDRQAPDEDARGSSIASDNEDEAHAESIRSFVLEEAGAIAGQMDDVLSQFPYSDEARLWKLRGDLARWTAYLIGPNADGHSEEDVTTRRGVEARDAISHEMKSMSIRDETGSSSTSRRKHERDKQMEIASSASVRVKLLQKK